MGLCNEERILRVLNSLVAMRKQLDPHDVHQWEEPRDRRLKHHLGDIAESLDQAVGILVQQTDTNGFFWFMGESDDSFRGLTMEFFNAEEQDLSSAEFHERMYGDREDREGDLTLRQFAFSLGFSGHEGMLNLAHWWDLWCYIPSALYGMNRYEDGLFKPELRQEVNRLIAKMQQLHTHLVGNRDQVEQVMLLKYKLYQDDKYKDARHYQKQCDSLREMTQAELEKEVYKRQSARPQDADDHHRKQRDKERKFLDPVYGKVTMTADGLVKDVRAILDDKKKFHYAKRLQILEALQIWDGDVEGAAEDLYKFMVRKQEHELRYGAENVKICDRCYLTVLDQRNKTGFCKDCLPAVRERGLLKKKRKQS